MNRSKSDGNMTWNQGWKADAETMASAPRWTQAKSGKHKYKSPWTPSPGRRTNPGEEEHTYLNNTMYTLGGGYRDTWVQAHTRKNRNPGPGHYQTDTDMPASKKLSTERDGILKFDWMRTTGERHDEVNVNNTKKERAPKYTTLGRKELREVSLIGNEPSTQYAGGYQNPTDSRRPRMKGVPRLTYMDKPSAMVTPNGVHDPDPAKRVFATPGPGHYTQLTTFGAASGGHRKHYFAEGKNA